MAKPVNSNVGGKPRARMDGSFSNDSYDEIGRKLSLAIAWMHSLGLKISHTRLGEYQRSIDALTGSDKAAQARILFEALPRLDSAVFEAQEFIEIHSALAGKYDGELRAIIKQAATGPSAYTEEKSSSSSNRARNLSFELSVMAQFANAGLPLHFGSLADIAATFGQWRMVIECKRPQTLSAVRTLVKEALEQLATGMETVTHVRRRGVVAIDITKAVNPKFDFFVASSEQEIAKSMTGLVNQFIESHAHCWHSRENSRSIGALVCFRQMNVLKQKNSSKLYYGQQLGFVAFPGTSHRNWLLLRDLSLLLAKPPNAA